jgi:hypothetical protein
MGGREFMRALQAGFKEGKYLEHRNARYILSTA